MLTPRTAFELHRITDAESSRYALGAVRFERDPAGNPLAIATDGRRLMILGWAEAEADQYPVVPFDPTARMADGAGLMIPAAACREALKFKVSASLLKSKPVLANSVLDESAAAGRDEYPKPVMIAASALEKSSCDTVSQIEGRYPRWQDIVTPMVGEAAISMTIDARYLADILDIATKYTGQPDGPAEVVLSLDAADPTHRQLTVSARNAENGRTAYGVVMPMNDDCQGAEKHQGAKWLPVEFSKAAIAEAATAARRARAVELGADDEIDRAAALAAELATAKAEADREICELKARLADERNRANTAAADLTAERLALDIVRGELRTATADLDAERDRADHRVAELVAMLTPPAAIAAPKTASPTIIEQREPGRRFDPYTPPAIISEPPRGIACRVDGAPSRPAWQTETDETRRQIIMAVHC